MFRSIKTRLAITICAILLMVFTIQIAVNMLFAGEFYAYQKMNFLRSVFSQITIMAKSSDSSMKELLEDLEIDRNLEIYLADEDMQQIYTNRIPYNKMLPQPEPKDMIMGEFDFTKYPESYFKTTNPTVLKTDMIDGERIRLLGKIIREDGSTYYIAIRLSLQSITNEIRTSIQLTLYVSSFAIIAGGLVVYFMAKKFAKPIEDINQVAIRVSNLDFSARAKDIKQKDEIGSLAQTINLMSDRLEENIGNLREANRKLELDNEFMSKIDEQRKELIANISHELKTPLAILGGYAEMLQNDIPGIDKTFYYETIQDETQKMNILIQNLLNLSDMENRLSTLNLEKVNPVEFAEKLFRKYSVLFDKKGVRTEFVKTECRMVLADTLYLEEAINNYLSNAISYTKEGYLIRMKVEQKEDEVIISVFNEGSFIDDKQKEKIWNSFYREDKSRTRTSQNNIGLGLYIVRSIMNAHHGNCGVFNREDGVEFWLSLKASDIDNQQ